MRLQNTTVQSQNTKVKTHNSTIYATTIFRLHVSEPASILVIQQYLIGIKSKLNDSSWYVLLIAGYYDYA